MALLRAWLHNPIVWMGLWLLASLVVIGIAELIARRLKEQERES